MCYSRCIYRRDCLSWWRRWRDADGNLSVPVPSWLICSFLAILITTLVIVRHSFALADPVCLTQLSASADSSASKRMGVIFVSEQCNFMLMTRRSSWLKTNASKARTGGREAEHLATPAQFQVQRLAAVLSAWSAVHSCQRSLQSKPSSINSCTDWNAKTQSYTRSFSLPLDDATHICQRCRRS